MGKQDHHNQAKIYRQRANKLRQEAEKMWQKHVDLLHMIYPSPNPEHKIQALVNCNEGSFENLFSTSFPDILSYKQACDELGWPYGLCSNQVEVCHYCDQYYCADETERLSDDEGLPIEFCTLMCLENYEIKQAEEADFLEYMYECFPDQYEKVDGKISPKARTPKEQKAFKAAWERAIKYQEKESKP